MKDYSKQLMELSQTIWEASELKFREFRSADAICQLLCQEQFAVRRPVAGMETAFTATAGSGHPIIGILAEFDALDGLSQAGGVPHPQPRPETTCGHGCGHHLLGAAAVGAALMARDYLAENNLPGTVVLLGCPGEEGGSGKAYMARAGLFDELDIALTWHPGGANAVLTGSMQANCQAYFSFRGQASHAAATPHLGRSALDAVELMDVGVNYLREHMEPTDRIHYAITDTGGVSPNVVQSHAQVVYLIRSTDSEKVEKLYQRVCKIAQGAALMTETQLTIQFDKGCSNILSNPVLEQLLYESMQKIPLPEYTEPERQLAAAFCSQVGGAQEIASDIALTGLPATVRKRMIEHLSKVVLADTVAPWEHLEVDIAGSSDVGDCSHVVPTAEFVAGCFVPGTPGHSWQMTAQGTTSFAQKGMLYAAQVLADAACHVFKNPAVAESARQAFLEQSGGKPYHCPIPPEVQPHITIPEQPA
jgi:aminobenzoyl-glutamate utilization protein B